MIPPLDPDKFMKSLKTLEKISEKSTYSQEKKQGVFAFGRKKTVVEIKGANHKFKSREVATTIGLYSTYAKPVLKANPKQLKEAEVMLGRIAKNFKTSEENMLESKGKKPTFFQKKRFQFLNKIINKGGEPWQK